MLIRLDNDELVEYPDELGALVLADPRDGDVPDFSLDVLNALISSSLGMLFDKSLALEQNIAEARAHYTAWGSPSSANMEKARALIASYNRNTALEDIGYSDSELINDLYCIPSAKSANQSIVIALPLNSETQLGLLTDANAVVVEG